MNLTAVTNTILRTVYRTPPCTDHTCNGCIIKKFLVEAQEIPVIIQNSVDRLINGEKSDVFLDLIVMGIEIGMKYKEELLKEKKESKQNGNTI